MVTQFYSTELRSEASKRSKNSIKINYVAAKPTLENYDGTVHDNLKQDIYLLSNYREQS